MLKRQRSSINNEKGMAVLEMIPILVVFVLFINFSLGFFGAIHSGILNSIASRNYAFETFRNRSNLVYFRNVPGDLIHYSKENYRFHGTTKENEAANGWNATARTIDFFGFERRAADAVGTDGNTHNNKVRAIPEGRNTTVGVNPIWIKTLYGICLNAKCES